MTVFAMAMGLPNARQLGKGPWHCCQGRWTWASKTGRGGKGEKREEKETGGEAFPARAECRSHRGWVQTTARKGQRARRGFVFTRHSSPPPPSQPIASRVS